MSPSRKVLDFLMDIEKFVPVVYKDAAGKDTIGFGHLIKPGEFFQVPMSKEQGRALFAKDVAEHAECIDKYVKVPLTQGQYDCLVSFVFNAGCSPLKKKMAPSLNAGDYSIVKLKLPQYVYGTNEAKQKIKINGLVKRRAKEMEFWDS